MTRSTRRKLFAPPLLALALLCLPPAPSASAQRSSRRTAPVARAPRGAASAVNAATDARLRRLADEYLRGHFDFNPTAATAAGLHDYDERLEERSPEALAAEARRLRSTLAALARLPEWRLSAEARYDFLALSSHARARLLDLEEAGAWRRDPALYVRVAADSVNNVLKREYAPGERRLDAMLARERQIPRLLAEARLNLQDPPRLYTETALEEARGGLDFFARVVPQLVERAGGGRLTAERRAEINAVNESAAAALRDFAAWLERDLLPRSAGDFRLGAELYRRKLLHGEMVETPLAALARAGEEELRRTQEAMRAVAEEVAPGRGVRAALETLERERPTPSGLVGDTRAELDRLRAFVGSEEILTAPTGGRLAVAETPEYARALTDASMDAPGPFERAADEAFYYVTPPDASADARAADEYLARFNRYAVQIVSIHEAYPGHFYQQLSLRRTPSRVRAVLGSKAFVEGWAHYSEQMMLDEGYGGNNPKLRLAQLHAALVELCRYLAGIGLHTSGMPYERAVDLFMREGYLPRSVAEREARRAAHDPEGLLHALGKMEIMSLREEWRRQMGDSFSLGEFHERLLSYGMPPVKVLRMAMLGDAGRAPGQTAAEQSVPVDFSVIATGQMSGYEGARRVELVTTEEQWRAAWDLIGEGRPLPEVNFDARAALVVYQGQKPTGGYGVEVLGVRRVGTVLAVKVNERRPASGDVTTQALTSPYVAATIPRPPSGVRAEFDEPGRGLEKGPEGKEVTRPRPRRPRRRGPRRGR